MKQVLIYILVRRSNRNIYLQKLRFLSDFRHRFRLKDEVERPSGREVLGVGQKGLEG